MQKSSNYSLESCLSDSCDILAAHEDMENNVSRYVTNEWDNEKHDVCISKTKNVELGLKTDPKVSDEQNIGLDTSEQEYFDNLLEMIEESVKDLKL